MAIKFEKIQPGMTLYDRHRHRMGNTTLRTIGEWPVEVISVDAEKRTAVVSWNGNRPEVYFERELKKLSTWSEEDDDVAINGYLKFEKKDRRGFFGQTSSVKKIPKKEFEARQKAAIEKAAVEGSTKYP